MNHTKIELNLQFKKGLYIHLTIKELKFLVEKLEESNDHSYYIEITVL